MRSTPFHKQRNRSGQFVPCSTVGRQHSVHRLIWTALLLTLTPMIFGAAPDSEWSEEQKLTASDAAQNENFGSSVSILGNYALVGAPNRQTVVDGYVVWTQPGKAYVFRRSGDTWIEEQQLLAFDGEAGDRFGGRVALHNNLALIAAPRDDIDTDPSSIFGDCGGGPCLGAGSVYVYQLQADGAFAHEAKLVASDGIRFNGRFAGFGGSLDMDGSFAVIGAAADDLSGVNTDFGSAYVFERVGTSWYERAKLTASDGQLFDFFGTSVAISGTTIMVGATQPWSVSDGAIQATYPGKVYVFEMQPDGSWPESAIITPSDGAPGDLFGVHVTVSGNTALIAATRHDESGSNSGVVYVFEKTGVTWSENSQVVPIDNSAFDSFGSDLAMHGDRFVAGATYTDEVGVDSGSAYVFRKNIGGNWVEDAKIWGDDTTRGDLFGLALGISGDRVIAGVDQDNPEGHGTFDAPGSAYVFSVGLDSVTNNCCSHWGTRPRRYRHQRRRRHLHPPEGLRIIPR